MAEPSNSQFLYTAEGEEPVEAHRFTHQAMATLFEVICAHENRAYAEQAARAAFDLIDRMESELTCRRASGDLCRINRLPPGGQTAVGMWTLECLQFAKYFHMDTNGAFDISLGTGLDAVEIVAAESAVRIHREKISLDLGGIGKGFAIDRVRELLDEWEIGSAIIHGGFSSVLVLDPPPDRAGWPLTITVPGSKQPAIRVAARREAWSASGIRKKDHIVNPRNGIPVRDRPAAWASGSIEALRAIGPGNSPSAAAEAFSTAFMIMPLEEIAGCCRRHTGLEARILTSEDLLHLRG